MKKHIIYIGGFQLPDRNAAAQRVIGNAKALRDLDYEVVLIGVSDNTNKTYPLNIEGFQVWERKYPKKLSQWCRYMSETSDIINIINSYQNIKAIICYNFQSVALSKMIRYSKKTNIPIISDVTEWYGPQGKNIILKMIKGLDSFLRMRILNRKVTSVIAISSFLYDYYKNKIDTFKIPPLVDCSSEKWDFIDTYKEQNKKIKFIYSGSPGFRKDKINVLVEVFTSLSNYDNFVFNIVGISKNEYLDFYPEHKKIIQENDGIIIFLGRVTHKQAIKELYESDYSIFYREPNIITKAGFPTKLVESLTCSVPVITNNIAHISEYLNDGDNGYIIETINFKSDIKKLLSDILSDKIQIERDFNRKIFDYKNYMEVFKRLIISKEKCNVD